MLPICIKALIEPRLLTWPQLIEKLTINPARVLGIDRGTLKPGAIADVTIIDPRGGVDDRSKALSFEGEELSLHRLGSAWTGGCDDRGWADQI